MSIHGGDLGGGEAQHLEQQQRGALVAGQVLQRGDERELDGLALLVAAPGASGYGLSQATSVSGASPTHRVLAGRSEVDGQRAPAAAGR